MSGGSARCRKTWACHVLKKDRPFRQERFSIPVPPPPEYRYAVCRRTSRSDPAECRAGSLLSSHKLGETACRKSGYRKSLDPPEDDRNTPAPVKSRVRGAQPGRHSQSPSALVSFAANFPEYPVAPQTTLRSTGTRIHPPHRNRQDHPEDGGSEPECPIDHPVPRRYTPTAGSLGLPVWHRGL